MLPAVTIAFLIPLGPAPVGKTLALSVDAQWAAIEACPRIVNQAGERSTGTGVVVAVRDGFAYILTAHHVAGDPEEREVQFFTRKSYPVPARKLRGVQVLAKYPDTDAAVLKLAVGDDAPAVLPLAGIGQRPKRFPFDSVSVGCSNGKLPTCRGEQVVGKKFVRRQGDNVAFFWELADPPLPGRSGGPLIDAQGRVIGLCAASRDRRGYYAHLDEILAGLKRDELGWLIPANP